MTLLDLCAGDTYLQRTAAVFRSRPNQWIHWTELAQVGGALAWRTRCSDLGKPTDKGGKYGWRIEAKIVQRPDGVKDSYRRYVPTTREPKERETHGE